MKYGFHIWILFSKQPVVLICKTLQCTEIPSYSFNVQGYVYLQDTINAHLQTPINYHCWKNYYIFSRNLTKEPIGTGCHWNMQLRKAFGEALNFLRALELFLNTEINLK